MSASLEDSESFDESFSDEDEHDSRSSFTVGLAHVRRLEQENDLSRANTYQRRELKLIGEPSSKKPKLCQSAETQQNRKSTTLVLNQSDPGLTSCSSNVNLALLSESYTEFLPRKCAKIARRAIKTRTKPSYFEKMSDEVIVKIFSYLKRQELGRCASVCRRFKQISYDETLWKRIKMYNKSVSSGVVGQVLHRGTWYMSLAKATLQSPVMSNKSFSYPMPDPNKLRYLDMGACSISIQDLEDLTSTCHGLEKLSLEKICNLTKKICDNIAQSAKTLRVLNLCDCAGLDSQGIQKIAKECTSLTELNLAFTNLDNLDISTICETLPPTLQKLSLAGCRASLLKENVESLVKRCNNLLELDLSDATLLETEAVHLIVDNLSDTLKKFAVSRCFKIDPTALLGLQNMKELQVLNVYGMLVPAQVKILKEQLKHLSINEYPLCYVARSTPGDKKNQLWDVKLWH